jgi:hypothetical protein
MCRIHEGERLNVVWEPRNLTILLSFFARNAPRTYSLITGWCLRTRVIEEMYLANQ